MLWSPVGAPLPAFRAPVGTPMMRRRVVCPRSHPASPLFTRCYLPGLWCLLVWRCLTAGCYLASTVLSGKRRVIWSALCYLVGTVLSGQRRVMGAAPCYRVRVALSDRERQHRAEEPERPVPDNGRAAVKWL